jgi:3-oxoacyl-[acyl-carrier protein] reductase
MTERRALVTGASRGIGAAIARSLAAAGYAVIVNYRENTEAAQSVKAAIERAGGEAELKPFDVTDGPACAQAISELLGDRRPIGVLVNNAGIVRDAPFPALARADWDALLATTLAGFYNVTQPLTMPMVQQRWGRIINLTSVAGLVGNRGQVGYSAVKAGLIGATKALARELAKRHVTVNAVAPGLIDTDMTRGLTAERVRAQVPMGRLGLPREVADLVSFLASDGAAYINGQVIAVDGALSLEELQ